MNAYQCMTWTDEIRKGNGQSPLYENIKGGYLDGTINRNQYGDTDWMDVVFRSVAPQTRHSLSVSGGSEKVKFTFQVTILIKNLTIETQVWIFKPDRYVLTSMRKLAIT